MAERTVLITGGAGFIGSHLARLLAESGDRVVLFDRGQPGPEAEWLLRPLRDQLPLVVGDVRDADAIRSTCADERVTDIVHIGAIASTDYLLRRPREAFTVNLGGTFNVLEAMRELGLRRLVYFSSVGVLPPIQYEPIDAAHPLILGATGPGTGPYGAAKASSELFCFAYRQAYGLDFVVIRPSAVYGLGMRIPNFIKPMVENSVRGEPTRFDHGKEFGRDYTHVADLAQLAQRALDAPADTVRDRVFYGATGQPLVTAGRVAELVREVVPGANIEIGSGLSEEDRWKAQFRGLLDVAPARQQLGYAPRYPDLREGIVEYVESYRQFLADTSTPPR